MADGDIKYSKNANASTAYVEVSGKQHKALLTAIPDGTLELSDNPNVDSGYLTDENGKKHKVKLVAPLVGGGGGDDPTVLHNTATGENSLTVNGTNSAVNESVNIGSYSTASQNRCTSLGYSAHANGGLSTAIGSLSNANDTQGVALGYYANAAKKYTTAIGTFATCSSNYSTALGTDAKVNTSSAPYAMALGYGATVTAGNAVQIGQGTNSAYGSLQFRSYELVTGNGKVPNERLNYNVASIGTEPPYIYNTNQLTAEEVKEIAYLYTGETNNKMTDGLWYRGSVNYDKPCVYCDSVDNHYINNITDVEIDQNKFFQKLAEKSKELIDDDAPEMACLGGGYPTMEIDILYDQGDETWEIHPTGTSLENGFQDIPASFQGIEDLSDWGISLNYHTLPTNANTPLCTITYLAPIWVDELNTNDFGFTINYAKLMDAMCDSQYGFGYVIPNLTYWTYTVDGTTYKMPNLPESYEANGEELSWVYFKIEFDGQGSWNIYQNNEETRYSFETAQLKTVLGIDITSNEQDVGYIEICFNTGQQRTWKVFNPFSAESIQGYDANRTQYLSHDASGNLKWENQ